MDQITSRTNSSYFHLYYSSYGFSLFIMMIIIIITNIIIIIINVFFAPFCFYSYPFFIHPSMPSFNPSHLPSWMDE